MIRDEKKVAEEYCWALTQAPGLSSCDRSNSSVLSLNFSWTPLYLHVWQQLVPPKCCWIIKFYETTRCHVAEDS